MRILVTGASGFLGTHLVRGLAEAFSEAAVIATDRAEPTPDVGYYWRPYERRIAYRRLDVTDRAAVAALFDTCDPTHVIHAAALTPGIEEEAGNPAAIVDINIGGTVAVVDAATRRSTTRRVIIVSSGAVLGAASSYHGLVDEDAALHPEMLYGVTKVASEGIASRLGALRGVSVISVRLASVYGAMERVTSTRQRTSLIHRLVSTEGPVSVSAEDVVRDWIHADDVALAIAGLLKVPHLKHDIFNIGGGEPVGWRRIVEIFRKAGLPIAFTTGQGADIVVRPQDARPIFSIARLVDETGFRPRSIEDGIRDVIAQRRAGA